MKYRCLLLFLSFFLVFVKELSGCKECQNITLYPIYAIYISAIYLFTIPWYIGLSYAVGAALFFFTLDPSFCPLCVAAHLLHIFYWASYNTPYGIATLTLYIATVFFSFQVPKIEEKFTAPITLVHITQKGCRECELQKNRLECLRPALETYQIDLIQKDLNSIKTTFLINRVPVLCIVDRYGTVLQKEEGRIEELETLLQRLLPQYQTTVW